MQLQHVSSLGYHSGASWHAWSDNLPHNPPVGVSCWFVDHRSGEVMGSSFRHGGDLDEEGLPRDWALSHRVLSYPYAHPYPQGHVGTHHRTDAWNGLANIHQVIQAECQPQVEKAVGCRFNPNFTYTAVFFKEFLKASASDFLIFGWF